LQDLPPVAGGPGLRISPAEREGPVRLLGEERDQLCPRAEQEIRLGVDVIVIDADDREPHGGIRSHGARLAQPFMPVVLMPSPAATAGSRNRSSVRIRARVRMDSCAANPTKSEAAPSMCEAARR